MSETIGKLDHSNYLLSEQMLPLAKVALDYYRFVRDPVSRDPNVIERERKLFGRYDLLGKTWHRLREEIMVLSDFLSVIPYDTAYGVSVTTHLLAGVWLYEGTHGVRPDKCINIIFYSLDEAEQSRIIVAQKGMTPYMENRIAKPGYNTRVTVGMIPSAISGLLVGKSDEVIARFTLGMNLALEQWQNISSQ